MNNTSLIESLESFGKRLHQWSSSLRILVDHDVDSERVWSRLWSAWLKAADFHEEISKLGLKCQRTLRDLEQKEARSQRLRSPKRGGPLQIAARWTGSYAWSSANQSLADVESTTQSEEDIRLSEAREVASQIERLLLKLMIGEQQLREYMLSLPPESLNLKELNHRLDQLSEALVRNNRDTQLSDLEESRRALRLVHESRLIKRLMAHCDGKRGTFQIDLISETFSLGEVDWYLSALKVANAEGDFGEMYLEGLEREVTSFEARAEVYIAQAQSVSSSIDSAGQQVINVSELLTKAWRCLLRGGELQVTVHVAPIKDGHELIERCHAVRKSLRALISTLTQTLDEEMFTSAFTELSWEMLYYSSELMSDMDHTSINCSIFRLNSVAVDINWYLAWPQLSEIDLSDHPHFAASLKRLRKQSHQVRVELQEKRLQDRLENIFGERAVKRFEQLIFILIFVVLALLFYEFVAVDEKDHETRRTLALIDTGICLIFLTEFFVKIGLTKDRLFYLKRRWFIDLLPSIPFMYFTDYLFLEHVVAARSARLVQISRIARYIRVVRPFIRVVRLVSFTLRGMDRLVRRYSQWLDHNLLFFEPSQSIYHRPEEADWERANRIYAESLALMRQLSAQLDSDELASLLPHYINTLSGQIRGSSARIGGEDYSEGDLTQKAREIPVEHVIHQLVHLQGAELESMLGYQFPKRLYMLMGLFDFPLLNRIPILRTILTKRRHSTASEFAAWWLRGFGKALELLMSLGYWFADLYGVVTGPKLIDRVGSTLVRSFERPAKRLLIFGALLLTLQIFVSGLEISFLDNIVTALQRFVGLPMIVIGSICFVPLILGRWMKKIAGQAEGLYRLTAEAQFINLLKDLKEQQASDDLCKIYERVVAPEEGLAGLISSSDEKMKRRTRFMVVETQRIKTPLELLQYQDVDTHDQESYPDPAAFYIQPTQPQEGQEESDQEDQSTQNSEDTSVSPRKLTPRDDFYWVDIRLHHLYRDYLDGALLHHTDIKTTEQLLGNLSMRSLFDYKLNLTPNERKQIEKLDLGTQRSLIGPFMWFNLITQSISQASAQLVIDYNRFALPLHGREYSSPKMRTLFEQWLAHKHGEGMSHAELEEAKRDLPLFNTTDITILQILAEQKSYKRYIKARFGDEVLELLNDDQKKLIRGIFSCYPLYQLPKPIRTLNPYQLYNEFIQGGQIFWLPFRVIGLVFKGLMLGLKWTKEKIDEIRFPDKIRSEIVPQKDFVVAQRKIDRMRKPIFMKLLSLRAQVDFAYLGINVGGIEPLNEIDDEPLVYQDLDIIKAIEVERLPIHEQIDATQSSLREFYDYLEQKGLTGSSLRRWVEEHYPHLVDRQGELLRAFLTAYLCNFKEIQSYLQTKIKLTDFFEDSLNGLPNKPFRLHNRMLTSASRATARLVTRGEDRERMGFKVFWEHLGFDRRGNPEEMSQDYLVCWQRYLSEGRDLNSLLIQFAQAGLPDEDAIFHEVAQTLSMWTDELITLRMIQTLALMDIENYRRYIRTVGSYDDDEDTQSVSA
jgi:hypothetical protein